ncbi:MAG: hypothetical protein SF066_12030 [Thermoanaerobaculia bacterium]|nr:hypothetical protein [Thermoanaerobaculia bacterium]
MIHVRVRPEDISEGWLEKAQRLTAELEAFKDDGPEVPEERRKSASDKRKALIEKNSGVWKELKGVLMRWSHGKCWYSELKDHGSDFHVDHFRPKGRVRDQGEEDTEGYWFLAFDWKNYRLSVAWCNSAHSADGGPAQGKQDQFPVGPKGKRATCKEDDLDRENCVLLDPTNANDVVLVDFDETGLPVATAGGWTTTRVRETTRILHLDAPRMLEARQAVWRTCREELASAHALINQESEDMGTLDKAELKRSLKRLRELIAPQSELSAVARACIVKFGYRWALSLLNAA